MQTPEFCAETLLNFVRIHRIDETLTDEILKESFVYLIKEYTNQHQPQGYSLQQVSDAWDAGAKYTYLADSVFETVPNKEQYLSNLTPAPDVKEVAVAFWQYTINNSKDCPDIGNNVYDIFDYWYENIYPQSKK